VVHFPTYIFPSSLHASQSGKTRFANREQHKVNNENVSLNNGIFAYLVGICIYRLCCTLCQRASRLYKPHWVTESNGNTKEELKSLPLARMHTSTSFSVGGGGVLVFFFVSGAFISTAAVNQVRGCHQVSHCHWREREDVWIRITSASAIRTENHEVQAAEDGWHAIVSRWRRETAAKSV